MLDLLDFLLQDVSLEIFLGSQHIYQELTGLSFIGSVLSVNHFLKF